MRTTALLKNLQEALSLVPTSSWGLENSRTSITYLLVTCYSQQEKSRPRENQEFYIDTKTHFSSPIYSDAEHNLLLNDFNFWEEETKQFWGIKE